MLSECITGLIESEKKEENIDTNETTFIERQKKRRICHFWRLWEKGEAQGAFSLKDNDGTLIPMQSRALAYWPDGSIKWSGHVQIQIV